MFLLLVPHPCATKGKVIFQNELMQLLQYAPSIGEVKRRPLLIIPPLNQQVLHPRANSVTYPQSSQE